MPTPVVRRLPGPAGEKANRADGASIVGESRFCFAAKEGGDRVPGRGAFRPEEDRDFFKGPWLTLLCDLGIQSCENPSSAASLQASPAGQSAFKTNSSHVLEIGYKRKVPLIALVIHSLTHVLETASVVFKDPFGLISGTIHSEVLQAHPKLAAGSVVLLEEVPPFSRSYSHATSLHTHSSIL
jgi:hypothetical protein